MWVSRGRLRDHLQKGVRVSLVSRDRDYQCIKAISHARGSTGFDVAGYANIETNSY
jgi:hypothetical protein